MGPGQTLEVLQVIDLRYLNTFHSVLIARITVETPYLSRENDVQCLTDGSYNLIIGNA